MSLVAELKRRNVFKVGIAYAVGAWLLLQLTDVLSQLLSLPTTFGPVVVAIVAIGFPVVLFVAWAYELTPEGIKRESEVDRSQSIAPQTGKKLNNAIMLLLVLAVGWLLYDKFSVRAPETPATAIVTPVEEGSQVADDEKIERLSIAVLPFDNRSNREEDQFFTDGIHDDLLTTIAKIRSMKVISRTSVMEYRDTTKKIPEIAAELGVAHVMEGGIQRSGDQVRINVQLIDAVTDEHLWAEIYDRELTAENLFAIQSEISKAIADALQATLSPEEEEQIDAMPTANLAAYDAYLRGRQLMATRRSAQLREAIAEFRKAVELDPGFALAWVNLGDATSLEAEYGSGSRSQVLDEVEQAAQRALSIDPSMGEAYATLGTVYSRRGQGAESEAAFRKAIELSPNYATAYHWFSNHLNDPLRAQEGVAMAQRAVELDPRAPIVLANLGGAYARQGLFSLAEQQMLKVNDLFPDFAITRAGLAFFYGFWVGRLDEGLILARESSRLDPGNPGPLIMQMRMLSNFEEAGDALDVLRDRIAELAPGSEAAVIAEVLIALVNDRDQAALETMNTAKPMARKDPDLLHLLGVTQYLAGDPVAARASILEANPGWIVPDQWEALFRRYPDDVCLVSDLVTTIGMDEHAGRLLEDATQFVGVRLPTAIEHPDLFQPELCFLASGRNEDAMASIEQQLAHRHLFAWDLYFELPAYDAIRHEARFQAALAERKEILTGQWAHLQEVGWSPEP